VLFIYLSVTAGVVAVVYMLIRRVPKESNGFLVAAPSILFLSILLMIKVRCRLESYPCGFMSFTGGFTWHILIGLGLLPAGWFMFAGLLNNFKRKGVLQWMQIIGFCSKPLLGLSVAVIWEILPVSVIHPPSHGGPCPNIPVLCRDLSMFGFGGLLYWSAPFVIWALFSILNGIRSEFGKGAGLRNTNAHE